MTHDPPPNLDARALEVLLRVLETGSVSAAAVRTGVSQSAVSHTLERLRTQFGDPLFVRAGRGITPTRRARELEIPVRALLDDLRALTARQSFDPAGADLHFAVAANDFQRDLLLPTVYRRVRDAGARLRLDVVPSGVPSADVLSHGHVDLLITPHPPEGSDIFQRRLLRDRMVCFFDGDAREPPDTRTQYLAAPHITLQFAPGEQASVDVRLAQQGVARRVELRVAAFSAVASFLRGSDLVATLPSRLQGGLLKGFDRCPVPVDTGPFALYMLWHRRVHRDAAHRWFREQVLSVAKAEPPSGP